MKNHENRGVGSQLAVNGSKKHGLFTANSCSHIRDLRIAQSITTLGSNTAKSKREVNISWLK